MWKVILLLMAMLAVVYGQRDVRPGAPGAPGGQEPQPDDNITYTFG